MLKYLFLFFLVTPIYSDVLTTQKGLRDKISKSLSNVDSVSFPRQIFRLQNKYQKLAKIQMDECEDTEKIGDLRNQCLMNLRNWQIDTEKKFFKAQREFLKDNYQKIIRELNKLEIETVNNVIKQFPGGDKN